MARTKLSDLAQRAGVSIATVDRVLNGRLPVRAETARRVLEAAQASGFHAADLIRKRIESGIVERRLGILLLRRSTQFYAALGAALEEAIRDASGVRGRAKIEYLQDLAPKAVADRILALGQASDVIAVVAADHPSINQAVQELGSRGVPTIALMSDLSVRAAYVGLNARKAGRTAGQFLARFCKAPGKVGILVGSHRYIFQELCEISFRAYFREHAPDFVLLEPMANMEDPGLAHEATLDLLRRHPDLAGLYVPGGGAEGVIAALRGESATRSVVVICQDIMGETRAGLTEGVVDLVISHPIPALAQQTVRTMLDAVKGPFAGAIEVLLPFDITVTENI